MGRAEYPYRSGGAWWPAAAILAVALSFTLVLPAADLRLLAFLFALPSLVWLGLEWRRRATRLILEAETLHLGRPFRPGSLELPYGQVGGIQPWEANRIGIVFHVPRPAFEGEVDPRPPRMRVAVSAPLADRAAALADLSARLADAPRADPRYPALPAEQVQAYLRRRRWRRGGLAVALILASPLLAIVLFRLGYELVRALRLGG